MSEVERTKFNEINCDPNVDGRPIDGYIGYCITPDGQAWTCKKNRTSVIIEGEWRKLKKCRHPKGYVQYHFSQKGKKKKTIKAHTLVLTAFVGFMPENTECCHENGDKTNNNLSNLRWDTRLSNRQDQFKHGTSLMGEKCFWSKLKEYQVIDIIRRLKRGAMMTVLAKEYGVSEGLISNIKQKRKWKHVHARFDNGEI